MPQCQYIFKGETVTKKIATPQKITRLNYWYRECRKVIKELPAAELDTYGPNDWIIFSAETDTKWIKFDLHSKIGERAYIVILR